MSSYSIISYPAKDLPEVYEPLIYSKWLRSLRFGEQIFKDMDSNEYYTKHHAYIKRLLSCPDTSVRLAVLSEDHDIVLGFSVSRGDILDYVHVHKDYRRMGIGRALLPEKITTITHLTKTARRILGESKDQYFIYLDFKMKFKPYT